jgi:hypothetical protein
MNVENYSIGIAMDVRSANKISMRNLAKLQLNAPTKMSLETNSKKWNTASLLILKSANGQRTAFVNIISVQNNLTNLMISDQKHPNAPIN